MAKKKKKKDSGLRTTKQALRTVVSSGCRQWIKEIEKAEKTARIINFDTHALLNILVLSQDKIPPITLPWVINLQKAVLLQCTVPKTEVEIWNAREIWLKTRSENTEIPLQSSEGLHNILNYNAEQILTSIQNLVAMTTYKRHCRYVKEQLVPMLESECTPQNIRKYTLSDNKAAKFDKATQKERQAIVRSAIASVKTFLQRESFGVAHTDRCNVGRWDQVPLNIRQECQQFVANLRSRVPDAYFQDHEHLWIPYLKYLSTHSAKPFAVVPQCHNYRRRAVLIDTPTAFLMVRDPGLKSLLKGRGITYNKLYFGKNEEVTEEQKAMQKGYEQRQKDLKQKLGVKRLHYKTYEKELGEPPVKRVRISEKDRFDLVWGTFLKKMSKKKFGQFHGMLRTDGVSVSLVMQRQEKRVVDESEEVKQMNDRMRERVAERTVVIGLDPGIRDIFTTVRHDDCKQLAKDTVTRLSNTKYQHLRGIPQYNYGMKCLKRTHPEIGLIECKLPTTRTGDFDTFLRGVSERYAVCDKLWDFYGRRKLADMKLSLYQKSQKGERDIVKRLYGGNKAESTVVAFGAAGFTGAHIRGHAPSATGRGLRKMVLRVCGSKACVVDVNEDGTSQTCSKCGEKLSSFGLDHAVRRCQSDKCSARLWNRDVNAARNILQKFIISMQRDHPNLLGRVRSLGREVFSSCIPMRAGIYLVN